MRRALPGQGLEQRPRSRPELGGVRRAAPAAPSRAAAARRGPAGCRRQAGGTSCFTRWPGRDGATASTAGWRAPRRLGTAAAPRRPAPAPVGRPGRRLSRRGSSGHAGSGRGLQVPSVAPTSSAWISASDLPSACLRLTATSCSRCRRPYLATRPVLRSGGSTRPTVAYQRISRSLGTSRTRPLVRSGPAPGPSSSPPSGPLLAADVSPPRALGVPRARRRARQLRDGPRLSVT